MRGIDLCIVKAPIISSASALSILITAYGKLFRISFNVESIKSKISPQLCLSFSLPVTLFALYSGYRSTPRWTIATYYYITIPK